MRHPALKRAAALGLLLLLAASLLCACTNEPPRSAEGLLRADYYVWTHSPYRFFLEGKEYVSMPVNADALNAADYRFDANWYSAFWSETDHTVRLEAAPGDATGGFSLLFGADGSVLVFPYTVSRGAEKPAAYYLMPAQR